jgi:hypothetical protein
MKNYLAASEINSTEERMDEHAAPAHKAHVL